MARTGLVTEVRPGTYIFGDWMLTKRELCSSGGYCRPPVCNGGEHSRAGLCGARRRYEDLPMDIPLDTPPFLYPGYAIPIGEDGKPDETCSFAA